MGGQALEYMAGALLAGGGLAAAANLASPRAEAAAQPSAPASASAGFTAPRTEGQGVEIAPSALRRYAQGHASTWINTG